MVFETRCCSSGWPGIPLGVPSILKLLANLPQQVSPYPVTLPGLHYILQHQSEYPKELALEIISINKVLYFMHKHLASCECKLCLILHNGDSYLTHTQGKNHQTNFALGVAKEACTLGRGEGEVYKD